LAQTGWQSFNDIFLIQGIGGIAKSFGQMKNYLKRLEETGRAIASVSKEFDHFRSSIYLKNYSTVKFEK
jgi:hypothetical protein